MEHFSKQAETVLKVFLNTSMEQSLSLLSSYVEDDFKTIFMSEEAD